MKLYIWALIDTVVAILFILLIRDFGEEKISIENKIFAILFAAFLCPIVNLFVKEPIFINLERLLHIPSDPKNYPIYYSLLTPFIVGITEEGIKIAPLLFHNFNKFLKHKESAISIGFLFGLGFGIGEAWYLAYELTPLSLQYSFISLSGFGRERLMAIAVHLSLTAFLAYGISIKKGFLYYLLVVALHGFVDIFASLYQAGLLPSLIAGYGGLALSCLYFIALIRLILKFRKANPKPPSGETLFQRKEL